MNSSTAADRGLASAALAALLWAALGMCLLVGGYGLLLIGIDLSAQGEDWDGFGLLFGSMMAVPGLVVSASPGLRFVGRVAGAAVVVAPRSCWGCCWWSRFASGTPLLLVPMVVGIGLVGVALLGGSSEGRS